MKLAIVLLAAWTLHAAPLDSALEHLFRTNLLLTVAGLKPVSEIYELGTEREIEIVGEALARGELAHPGIEFKVGVAGGYETRGYDLDEHRRVTRVRPIRVAPHRFLRIMHRAALARRLSHPVVKDLLREAGFDPADPAVAELIWRGDSRSAVLAGVGYGFPARDVRSFALERAGAAPSVATDFAVGEVVPLERPAAHWRADRRRAFVTSIDGPEDYMSSITYGDQSKSAWAKLGRAVARIEGRRLGYRARGLANVEIFNRWDALACAAELERSR